jgi:hypothetical protein
VTIIARIDPTLDRLITQLEKELNGLFNRWPEIDPNWRPITTVDWIKKIGFKINWFRIQLAQKLIPAFEKMTIVTQEMVDTLGGIKIQDGDGCIVIDCTTLDDWDNNAS